MEVNYKNIIMIERQVKLEPLKASELLSKEEISLKVHAILTTNHEHPPESLL